MVQLGPLYFATRELGTSAFARDMLNGSFLPFLEQSDSVGADAVTLRTDSDTNPKLAQICCRRGAVTAVQTINLAEEKLPDYELNAIDRILSRGRISGSSIEDPDRRKGGAVLFDFYLSDLSHFYSVPENIFVNGYCRKSPKDESLRYVYQRTFSDGDNSMSVIGLKAVRGNRFVTPELKSEVDRFLFYFNLQHVETVAGTLSLNCMSRIDEKFISWVDYFAHKDSFSKNKIPEYSARY